MVRSRRRHDVVSRAPGFLVVVGPKVVADLMRERHGGIGTSGSNLEGKGEK